MDAYFWLNLCDRFHKFGDVYFASLGDWGFAMKTETKQAIDRLNQVIDDYINIFDSDKKEIKEIEQSLKILIKKTESKVNND